MGFPGGTIIKNPPTNAGNAGNQGIPGSRRSPEGRNSNPLQYTCLENPMELGTWRATYSPWGRKESDVTEYPRMCTHTHTHTHSLSYRVI